MATWHQNKASAQLYHEDKWTVVLDPPNKMRFVARLKSEQLCNEWIERLRQYAPEDAENCYILPPANVGK